MDGCARGVWGSDRREGDRRLLGDTNFLFAFGDLDFGNPGRFDEFDQFLEFA
jgi:hypothetical protein